jgi:predicted permease
MRRLRAWLLRCAGLFRQEQGSRDFADEIESHLQMHIADNLRSGMTPQEARRQALLKLGGVQQTREQYRNRTSLPMLEMLASDIRFGARVLWKSRGFTIVAIVTLALGIAGNTAIFSIVNGVLLNPLPFAQPEQLVAVNESKPNFDQGSISYPNFLDWQKDNHTFSAVAVARGSAFSLTGKGEAEQVNAEFVSGSFFPLLGVNPILGRTFTPAEEQGGAAPVALISEGLWQRKFSASPSVLGQNLTLDGRDFTVIGVIPSSFHLRLPSFRERDIYAPIRQWNNSILMNRNAGLGFHGIARLKPGVTLAQAKADMERVTHNLAVAFPDADKGIGASLRPLKEQMVGDVRPFLLVLLAAVGFLLLLACVNVASLLLARSAGRKREFAVRTALGASRSRVICQLLTESLLLGIVSGGIGLLLAAWGTHAALKLVPMALPRVNEIGLDFRVLAFTMGISLLSGTLFGLVPAWKTSQSDPQTALKEGGRGVSGTRNRTQSAFVVAEMAVALVLLIGAGLMVRSLSRLAKVDPGFNPRNVFTFGLSFPPSVSPTHASPQQIRAAFRELDDKLTATQGVKAVSQVWGALPMSSDDEQLFWLDGQPKPANEDGMNWAVDYIVEPGYLSVMNIPLQRGRFFTSQDDEHSPLVAVVDEVFARKYFPHQNPIGQRIVMNNGGRKLEVVGIVGHVKQWGLDLDDTQSLRAQVYIPCMQMPDDFITLVSSGTSLVVRYDGNLTPVFDAIRRTSRQMSSQQVIFGDQTMESIIADSIAARRFAMILLGAFAVLALGLAGIGIYGVIAYVVGQRTQEIGIRMALGAQRRDVLGLILWQGTRLALLGVAIGMAGAFALTRLMTDLLYGVAATDPVTFALLAAILTVVAMAACYLPARRATRVDPVAALRWE